MHRLDAEQIVNQISPFLDCTIDIFEIDGSFIMSSAGNSDVTCLSEEIINVVSEKKMKIVFQNDVMTDVYVPLYSDTFILCVMRLYGSDDMATVLSTIVHQHIQLSSEDNYHILTNSLLERSIRDMGRILVDELDAQKYDICVKRAKILNIDLSVPRHIIVIDFSNSIDYNDLPFNYGDQSFRDYLYANAKLIVNNNIFFNLSNHIYVCLYEIVKNSILDLDELYAKFSNLVKRPPIIGVGFVCTDIFNYNTSLNLALSTINYCKNISTADKPLRWNEYRTEILLLSSNNKIREAILEASSDIINYLKNKTDICETISAYFRCGMNIDKTAQYMHYHRNTILYRLNSFMNDSNIDIFNAKNCSEINNLILLLKSKENSL